jgi:hypothetical protein
MQPTVVLKPLCDVWKVNWSKGEEVVCWKTETELLLNPAPNLNIYLK